MRGSARALPLGACQKLLEALADGLVRREADPESLAQWWTALEDPLLTELIERAVKDNKSVQAAMARVVVEEGLTDLDLTPSHAEVILDVLEEHAPPSPSSVPPHLLIGGEPIGPALWARITALVERGVVRATNLYGPTECTVDATAGSIAVRSRGPHIGTALPGLRLSLLDAELQPVDPGQPGEIHLSGDRLARGYRGAPTLTAERFVPDPHGAPGTRMYRTGDLARRLEDGTLEYLGRTDTQFKLRGHRIEPVGDGVSVTLTLTWTGLFTPLAVLIFGKLARRYVQMEAEGLKRRCESLAAHA